MAESGERHTDATWDGSAGLSESELRRRRQRREYHQRRNRRTAAGAEHGRLWTIPDARTALDPRLSVPEAAEKVGRSANAVESLRRRWRRGQLPAALADQMPRPPHPDTAQRRQGR